MSIPDINLFGSSSEPLPQFFEIIICVLQFCCFQKPNIINSFWSNYQASRIVLKEEISLVFFALLNENHLNQEVL